MTMTDESKNIQASISLGRKIAYGAMGSAAATASLLAGTCLSRCNGCMGCLVGGTGLLGILAGSKMVEKFSAYVKGTPETASENKIIIVKGKGGTLS
jgi:hypothetical protein